MHLLSRMAICYQVLRLLCVNFHLLVVNNCKQCYNNSESSPVRMGTGGDIRKIIILLALDDKERC